MPRFDSVIDKHRSETSLVQTLDVDASLVRPSTLAVAEADREFLHGRKASEPGLIAPHIDGLCSAPMAQD